MTWLSDLIWILARTLTYEQAVELARREILPKFKPETRKRCEQIIRLIEEDYRHSQKNV